MTSAETVIIGGGISGLACARHLHDAGAPFLLITDQLGGRLALSEDGHYLGAVMMNNDYVHVKPHAGKAFKSVPWRSYIWDGSKGVNSVLRMLSPEVFRLGKVFGEFNRAYSRFRSEAPYVCQKTLMERDPLLRKLVSQSAQEFVKEHKIESITGRFLGPVAGAIFLGDWRQMNAFHFCAGISCLGNGSINADWTGTVESLTRGYTDKIIMDKVTSIDAPDENGFYQVKCEGRRVRAKTIVLSVPGDAGDKLLGVNGSAKREACHVFHIEGKRRALYRPGASLIMDPDEEILLFFPLPDAVEVVYSRSAEPDFSRYYEDYTIIAQHFWQPAIQLSRGEWRPLQRESNFFTIGDYNVCGLEDSYLTGLFAANKILAQGRERKL